MGYFIGFLIFGAGVATGAAAMSIYLKHTLDSAVKNLSSLRHSVIQFEMTVKTLNILLEELRRTRDRKKH